MFNWEKRMGKQTKTKIKKKEIKKTTLTRCISTTNSSRLHVLIEPQLLPSSLCHKGGGGMTNQKKSLKEQTLSLSTSTTGPTFLTY
jgi:hypothetical protein